MTERNAVLRISHACCGGRSRDECSGYPIKHGRGNSLSQAATTARSRKRYVVPKPRADDKPSYLSEVRSMFCKPTLLAYLRARNQGYVRGVGIVPMMNLAWMAPPPTPLPLMTERQRNAELGKQLKRLNGHRLMQDEKGYWYVDPESVRE